MSALLMTIVMGYTASRITFESDINKLKPKNNPAIIVKERMQQGIGTNFFPAIVTAQGPDLTQLLALTEEAERILEAHPDIALVEGQSAYLPSLKRQQKNLERLNEIDLEKSRFALRPVVGGIVFRKRYRLRRPCMADGIFGPQEWKEKRHGESVCDKKVAKLYSKALLMSRHDLG